MSRKIYSNQITTSQLEMSEMTKRAGSIYKCYAVIIYLAERLLPSLQYKTAYLNK